MLRRFFACALVILSCAAASSVAPTAQSAAIRVGCLSLPNCLRLSNGDVEVTVTTDIGPRIIGYALPGGENILGEIGGSLAKKGEWQPWGGHRLWIAPEGRPRSYGPDNEPIAHEPSGPLTITLTQPVEPATRIQKAMRVTLDARGSGVTVRHTLSNRGTAPFELAPWALTIMNGGGTAIVPQEPYRRHQDALLPARALILWHYTNLADPRFAIGPRFIRLSSNASASEPQKIGVMNKAGWAAYARRGLLFIKRIPWRDDAVYPDYGSTTEIFTQGDFIEVESLGPVQTLAPGAAAEHTERWFLYRADPGATEEAIEKTLAPLLEQSR